MREVWLTKKTKKGDMENKNWVELPNTITYSNNLEDYTKLVYAHIEFHLFFLKEQELPSKNSISKTLNLKFETVTKALQELTEKGLLQENNLYCITKDNQIDETIFSNTEAFTIKEHASKIGGFTKIPFEILSSKDLSSGERMSWIRIKSVKLDKIHWNGIATQTGIPLRTFKRHVKSLKQKGYLIYKVKRNSNKINDIEITDLELFQAPNANAIKAFEEEQKNKSNKIIETEEIKATVAEASKAEFDYYYDEEDFETSFEFDYYYDEDYEPKDTSEAQLAEASKAEDKVDNVVKNKEEKMTDEEFDDILSAVDDSPITKAINSNESKAEYNSIISNDLKQLNSLRKNIVIEMNNNPNKASIYYTKLIEIDEKIEKLNKKAA